MCLYSDVYTCTPITTYYCISLYILTECDFILMLMSLAPVHYHMNRSSFLPLIIHNIPLQQWKTWLLPSVTKATFESHIFQFRGVNLEAHGEWCISTVLIRSSLCLQCYTLHSFPKLHKSAPYSPTFFSEVVSYIYSTFRVVVTLCLLSCDL